MAWRGLQHVGVTYGLFHQPTLVNHHHHVTRSTCRPKPKLWSSRQECQPPSAPLQTIVSESGRAARV